MTNDASVRHRTALPWNPARDDGRAVDSSNVLTLLPETNNGNHPVVALQPILTINAAGPPYVLILSAVQHPGLVVVIADMQLVAEAFVTVHRLLPAHVQVVDDHFIVPPAPGRLPAEPDREPQAAAEL